MNRVFTPPKPRHIVWRLFFGVLGLGLITVLLFFSLFIGMGMLAGGVLFRLIAKSRRPRPVDGGLTVEGEYRVVNEKPALPISH